MCRGEEFGLVETGTGTKLRLDNALQSDPEQTLCFVYVAQKWRLEWVDHPVLCLHVCVRTCACMCVYSVNGNSQEKLIRDLLLRVNFFACFC